MSQQTCIENARNVALALQAYRQTHGHARTLSGVGLHIIATASTILIAGIAEKREGDVSDLILALKTCLRSLSEMEKTYLVARRVRRIIRLVMGLCHLDFESLDPQQETRARGNTEPPQNVLSTGLDFSVDNNAFQLGNNGVELTNTSWYDFLCPGDSPQGSAQFDIMYSLDC